MLAGLRYPDCRFADRLADGASAANPGELCRLFAMVSTIREELLHPRYVDLNRRIADDLISLMDLMRVIADETKAARPSQSNETAGWLRQWRRLWSDHAHLEQGPTGLLDRLNALPHADTLEADLKERLAGLERHAVLPVPEPVSPGRFRSHRRPASLIIDGSELENSKPRRF